MKVSQADFNDNLLELVSDPFRDQDSQKLIETAVVVWYGDIALLQGFSEIARNPSIDDASKKKALYILDTLRRYPCVSAERKQVAKEIILKNIVLKSRSGDSLAEERVKTFMLDRLAFEWGLSEDVSALMKDVLPYQTRHYAATQNAITGFNDDST
ncbi:hypothetical protein [Pseudomonas putida]|uniref:hypothetical protein n=1 Tax=Pseudomonas putida TaxID=303 RepID=UPI002023121A|nr:hypothetical protein [Pseudomonas putida]MCL8307621.1 hypothetical protein [Pseudomonas putida]